jgi:histidinol-phosphate phosphatase family protein
MMPLLDFGMIDRTILLLCGGKGSRSANPNLPKSLQNINGRTLLSIQLSSLNLTARHEVIFVVGWKAEVLIPEIEIEMKRYSKTRWKIVLEENPTGTNIATIGTLAEISTSEVMILLGDLYTDGDIGNFFEIWKDFNSDVLLIAHPNNHPYDSDLVKYDSESLIVNELLPKSRTPTNNDGNMALAGVLLLKRNVLNLLPRNELDLISAIFSIQKSNIIVRVFPAINTIMDVGNLVRHANVCKIDKDNRANPIAALFLDLDGTLAVNEEIKNSQTRISIDKRITELLAKITGRNIPIFIVSNQPGIAKGFFTWEDFDEYRMRLESYLGERHVGISRWFVCPHHPDSGFLGERIELKVNCECRKPGIKFARDAISFYKLVPKSVLMLGDSEIDDEFASSSSFNFQKVTLDEEMQHPDTRTTWEALKLVVENL